MMDSFDDLVASRKSWIADTLTPWCRSAKRADLLKADAEWLDIAGKVPSEKTLWVWAWSRFPALVHESLGIEETSEVELVLSDGRTLYGFPNSRKSVQGQLYLWGTDPVTHTPADLGPFSIDQIADVRRIVDDDTSE